MRDQSSLLHKLRQTSTYKSTGGGGGVITAWLMIEKQTLRVHQSHSRAVTKSHANPNQGIRDRDYPCSSPVADTVWITILAPPAGGGGGGGGRSRWYIAQYSARYYAVMIARNWLHCSLLADGSAWFYSWFIRHIGGLLCHTGAGYYVIPVRVSRDSHT